MELLIGFSIVSFITVLSIDTIKQRRQNRKKMENYSHD